MFGRRKQRLWKEKELIFKEASEDQDGKRVPEQQLLSSQIYVLFELSVSNLLKYSTAKLNYFMLIQNKCPEAEHLIHVKENLTYKNRFAAVILGNQKMVMGDVFYFLIIFS